MATDWLRYANQNATRRLPLDPKLVEALSFLPDLGVTMEVFSGGQPEKGSGLARIGSVRHDHGNAADAFFYKEGKRLDWSRPEDRPLFEDIVRRGKQSGITGFGAGPGYMQPGSMHIGFGSPGVWGAGGKSDNAPDWLRAAYGASGGRTDVIAEVLAAGGGGSPAAMAVADGPKGQESYPVFGGIPAAATAGAAMPTATAQNTSIPAAVQAAAKPTSVGMSDILGMMAMAQDQRPQFSPVQISGPSDSQANGLLQLVQALKGGMA